MYQIVKPLAYYLSELKCLIHGHTIGRFGKAVSEEAAWTILPPKAEKVLIRERRITAGYSGPVSCGKNDLEGPFVSIAFRPTP
jgi:hypothetical protein